MAKLKDSVDEYLWYAENSRHRSPKTIRGRRAYLYDFVNFMSDKTNNVQRVNNYHIDTYIAEVSNRITRYNTLIETASVNNGYISSIRAFFNWLRKVKDVKTLVIPSEIVDIKVHERHPNVLVFSQIAEVVKRCENAQDRLIIAVIFEAGLRIEELVNMKIEDLHGRKLDVVGKGDKHRITFMSEELADELRRFWESMGWKMGAAFRPLMHGTGGGYTNTDTIRQRIQRIFMKILGIKIKPHWLRHAFALNLLENGCGLRSIQKLLGHSKIETTMRYLGITDKFLEKEYNESFGGTVLQPAL